MKQNRYNQPVSRRRFLQHTAAIAGTAAGAQLFGMPFILKADSPNSKLRVAVVGAGGMGGYSFDSALSERLVAICDVDEKTVTERLKQFGEKCKDLPAPKTFY